MILEMPCVAEACGPTTLCRAKTTNTDLQALHRCGSLVSERTAVINQIRGFLLERGIMSGKDCASFARRCPTPGQADGRSPRMVRIVADLASDWRQLMNELNP